MAVRGAAAGDPDFTGGGDRVRYRIPVTDRLAPFRVEAELRYQPIGYRWARNLADYDAMETQRFVGWYEAMSDDASVPLARGEAVIR